MTRSKLYHRLKITGHILFWLASIILFALILFLNNKELSIILLEKSLVINLFFAAAVYTNLYVLFPRFLKQKNYIFYFFWLIVLLTAFSLSLQFLYSKPLTKIMGLEDSKSFNTNIHAAYFYLILLYVGVTSVLKFINDWISLQDVNLKLAKIEKQKLEAELKTLKGQLNPHFLFNSLNNIYSLSLIKSDKVPELILKLSDLMRHIIYESKENFISLEKELEFVNNFIELQRIRTSDKTNINYQITGKIPSAKIAPLIFEPFIDNAFKHGLPGTENPDFINISFNFNKEDFLLFKIENNFSDYSTQNSKNSGIGLENVKQRLKLLYAPEDFNLNISRKDNIHVVSLELKLK